MKMRLKLANYSVTLTKRGQSNGEPIPMAGVPYHGEQLHRQINQQRSLSCHLEQTSSLREQRPRQTRGCAHHYPEQPVIALRCHMMTAIGLFQFAQKEKLGGLPIAT